MATSLQPTDAAEPCQRMAWDSAFFGVEVARVLGDTLTPQRVPAIDAWCREHRIAWLNFLARSDDPQTVRACEDAGFRLTNLRLTLERRLCGGDERPMPSGVRLYREGDLENLLEIARSSYRDSRFYSDSRVSRERADEMFVVWTRQDCQGAAAATLVARDEMDRAVGYVTCPIDSATGWGSFGLVGVAEHARGRGVGTVLVEAGIGWASRRGLAGLSVVTQGQNIAAQRLYQRAGFVTRSLQLYYHKWYV